MGASLPAAARWVESNTEASGEKGYSMTGALYAANIIGAVGGCVFAGFYLLRLFDMATATFAAVAINGVIAAVSYWLSTRAAHSAPAEAGTAEASRPKDARLVYWVTGLSGLSALGAEVIWTRELSLMLGATTYTFSIILAVFLIGLGFGSAGGSLIARYTSRPRWALGLSQLLLAVAIAWGGYIVTEGLPNWPINPHLARTPWYLFQIDMLCAVAALLPATVFWGASFPLALACLTQKDRDPGALVGETYAANTIGSIVGALAFSLLLIPWLGSQGSTQMLIACAMVGALAMLIPARTTRGKLGLVAAAIVVVLLILNVSPMPWLAVAYGRRMSTSTNAGEPLYTGEGRNSSIVISRLPDGKIYFHVSGKVEASTEAYDMRLQRMLGHFPALFQGKAKSVLIVGFGAGVTAGSFVPHQEVERIQICEIEPLIPPASTQYFRRENYNVLNDPRTHITYDDARHFILTSKDKFDVITSDPIHPWVKGTATLYSTEYFELCKKHLNPGGVIAQWVPLYESDVETVKSELATFFKVFPNGTIWGNTNGGGYDTLLLAQNGPMKLDMDAIDQRLFSPESAAVAKSMRDVGFRNAVDMMTTYAGRAQDLAQWLEGAEVNRDLNLRLQYLAGMGVNSDRAGAIYDDVLRRLKFPSDLIVGSDARLEALKIELQNPSGR
jgi:spermidine synthase